MKKNTYICGGKTVEQVSTKTYFTRDKALFHSSNLFEPFCQKPRSNASFVYIQN